MVLAGSNTTWLLPWHGRRWSYQLSPYHMTIITTCRVWDANCNFMYRKERDSPTAKTPIKGEGNENQWGQCCKAYDGPGWELILGWNWHYYPMIPPVRTDPDRGRAWSSPVSPEGRTRPGPRLAVFDWTGLVWTSPNGIIFINFKVDRKLKKWDSNPCNPKSDTTSLHNNHPLRAITMNPPVTVSG